MGVESPKGLTEGDAGLDPGYEFISLPNVDNCCVNPNSPPSSTQRITHITSTKKRKINIINHTKLKHNNYGGMVATDLTFQNYMTFP